MGAKRWEEEHIKWAKENKHTYTNSKQFIEAFNCHFQTNITIYMLRGILVRGGEDFKISSSPCCRWNNEMNNWLTENYSKSMLSKNELAKKFNKIFNTNISGEALRSHCNGTLKLKKENLKMFISNYTQKTLSKEIGSEYVDVSNNYTYIKIRDVKEKGCRNFKKNWQLKQRYIYEQYYNVKIPRGSQIVFIDKDTTNFSIDNLVMVTKREYMRMISNGFNVNDKKAYLAGLEVVKNKIMLDDLQHIKTKKYGMERFRESMKEKKEEKK